MAQSWLRVSVQTHPAHIDELATFLIDSGSPGVVVKNRSVEAFFARPLRQPSLRHDIARFIGVLGRRSARRRKPRLKWTTVRQEDWEHSWKRFIKPRRVGHSFWVTPPWLEPPHLRDRRVIVIEPGLAFGTGTHATTRGCMEFLEQVAERLHAIRFSGLDVGTGSGILAIALSILGASEIWAIDNDPVALQVARANLTANGAERNVILTGASLPAIRRSFDVVVANLTAETIAELAAQLKKKVRPAKFLILSGIIRNKSAPVARLFDGSFRLLGRKRSGEWVTFLFQKK